MRSFFLLIILFISTNSYSQEVILTERLISEAGKTDFSIDWFIKTGDSFEWLNEEYDYSSWENSSTLLNKEELDNLVWEGVGWFKKELRIDSTLIGKQILFQFKNHFGASQVYLDDELLFRIGDFSTLPQDYSPLNPVKTFSFSINDTDKHLINIRYSNHNASEYNIIGLGAGFNISFVTSEYFEDIFLKEKDSEKTRTTFFLVVLLSLTIVHSFFLIFYPAGQSNFYFVLFSGGVTGLLFFLNILVYTESPDLILSVQKGIHVSWLVLLFGLLRFSYSFLKNTTPRQLNILLGIGVVITVFQVTKIFDASVYQALFTLMILIEVFRALLKAKLSNKQNTDLLIAGFIVFIGIALYSFPELSEFFDAKFPFFDNLLASTVFVFLVSVFLLRDFAKAQIKLEYKFLEVKHLSDRSIDQERRRQEKAAEQLILEKENQRKTAELEEARALQISMLPAQYPNTDFWDIDAYMEPSQEVGGDYYDFSLSRSGELTVALGDATGHGMKAGIIVATAKSYFHSLVNGNSNIEIIKKMSEGIKNVDIRMMYMGLMLLKCKKHSVSFTSAGMPPSLLYRSSTNSIEEVVLKAMPLGSNVNFPYKELNYQLEKGDVFLLFSDGLMELFNSKREQLGMAKISDQLLKSAHKPSSEILKEIKILKETWSGNAIQDDDVTVMVMKAK